MNVKTEPKIYMASRASVQARPERWCKLRELGLNIISTWHNEENVRPQTDMRRMWTIIEAEIRTCDALILYAEPNDLPLKGAFVEAGLALAYGKDVYVVFTDPNTNKVFDGKLIRQCLGSWLLHPNVRVCDELDTAVNMITGGRRDTFEAAGR